MSSSQLRVSAVLETCLYVTDLQETRRFYEEVLGLTFSSLQEGRHVFFGCGAGMVLFFLAEASREPGQDLPSHGTDGCGHVAFAVNQEELLSWREQLDRHDVAIETEIRWPHGGESLYFRDPSNNSIEIATPNIWAD